MLVSPYTVSVLSPSRPAALKASLPYCFFFFQLGVEEENPIGEKRQHVQFALVKVSVLYR